MLLVPGIEIISNCSYWFCIIELCILYDKLPFKLCNYSLLKVSGKDDEFDKIENSWDNRKLSYLFYGITFVFPHIVAWGTNFWLDFHWCVYPYSPDVFSRIKINRKLKYLCWRIHSHGHHVTCHDAHAGLLLDTSIAKFALSQNCSWTVIYQEIRKFSVFQSIVFAMRLLW